VRSVWHTISPYPGGGGSGKADLLSEATDFVQAFRPSWLLLVVGWSYIGLVRRIVDYCFDVSEEPTGSIFRADSVWFTWVLKLLERKAFAACNATLEGIWLVRAMEWG
jgi:hypothetical protein